MACKIKFQGKDVGEAAIKDYVDNIDKSIENKTFPNKTSYKEHRKMANILSAQNANDVQKFVAHKLAIISAQVDATNEAHYSVQEKKFIRTTNLINTDEAFRFKGEDDGQFDINREWGNQINLILDNAIEDKGLDGVDFSIIDKKQAQDIYNYFKYYDFGKGSVVLTQVKLYREATLPDGSKIKDNEGNEYDGVAGVADIVVIDKNGDIQVLDLKSSVSPTEKPFVKIKNGVSYVNSYDKKMGDNPSKKQRHAAQLTIYHNMIKSFGFSMNKRNPIGVLPIHIENVSGNKIIKLKPEKLIDNHQISSNFSYLDTYGKDEDLMSLMEKIRLNLGKRKDKAESENANQYFINTMIESIQTVNDVAGIEKFVDDMFTSIKGNEKTGWKGLLNRTKDILSKYQNNPDKIQFLNEIQRIKDQIDILKDDNILIDLNTLVREHNEMFGEHESGSILWKLGQITDAINELDYKFRKEIPEVIATILASEVTEESKTNVTERIKAKQEKLDKLLERSNPGKRTQALIDRLTKEIEEDKKRYFLDDNFVPDFKEMIKHEITVGGYKDVSAIDKLLTPAASTNVGFLSTFALTIKRALTEIRFELMDISKEAQKVLNDFLGGRSIIDNPPEKLYGKYISSMMINGKKIATLKGLIDYDKYMKNKNEARESEVDMEQWYAENTEERPDEDIVINGIMFVEGKNSIKKRMKSKMSKKSYESWLSMNPYEFYMPKLSKYKQDGFDDIKNDKIYVYVMKLFFKAQDMQPRRAYDYERFILPFMQKRGVDRFRENVLKQGNIKKYISYQVRDTFTMTEEDLNEQNYSDFRSIPQIYFNQDNMVEYDFVSKDILLSVLKYYDAATKYKVMAKYKSLADNLLSYVNETKPAAQDSNGFKMLSKAAKYAGLQKTPKDYKAQTTNNAAALLEMYIDVMIYGRKRMNQNLKVQVLGLNIDFGKVIDGMMNLASKTQIGFNIITPVANLLQGQTSVFIESFAKTMYTPKAWGKAEITYDLNLGELARDMMRQTPESKLGLMIWKYDPIQGDFYNNFGTKITGSTLSKSFTSSIGFALQNMGEHKIQVQAMIAQMYSTKVKTTDGGEMNMYDALEVVDGELKWKENVIPPDEIAFINKMHATNKRLHGIYNDQDPIMAGRYTVGRMMLFYRKFLAPSWKKRYKDEGFDYELGDFTSGTYRVFFSKLFKESNELLRMLTNRENTLTEFEKQNIRRALAEMIIIFLLGIITWALAGMMDDEEDEDKRYRYAFVLYFAMRLNSEISIYGAPTDPRHPFIPDAKNMINSVRNITALESIALKAFNLYRDLFYDSINLISGEDIERYKVDTAHFEKGTSKSYASFLKLMGMGTRSVTNMEDAIDQLIRMRGE